MFYHIHIVAIIVAAIAYMVVGSLWYSPFVLGKQWMKAVGMSDFSTIAPDQKKAMKRRANRAMIFNFLIALVVAFVLERILYNTPLVTLSMTLSLSVLIWLGFVAASNVTDYLYVPEKRSWTVYFINQGNQLATIVVMTIIIYFLT